MDCAHSVAKPPNSCTLSRPAPTHATLRPFQASGLSLKPCDWSGHPVQRANGVRGRGALERDVAKVPLPCAANVTNRVEPFLKRCSELTVQVIKTKAADLCADQGYHTLSGHHVSKGCMAQGNEFAHAHSPPLLPPPKSTAQRLPHRWLTPTDEGADSRGPNSLQRPERTMSRGGGGVPDPKRVGMPQQATPWKRKRTQKKTGVGKHTMPPALGREAHRGRRVAGPAEEIQPGLEHAHGSIPPRQPPLLHQCRGPHNPAQRPEIRLPLKHLGGPPRTA